MLVKVPFGAHPGQMIQMQTPDGFLGSSFPPLKSGEATRNPGPPKIAGEFKGFNGSAGVRSVFGLVKKERFLFVVGGLYKQLIIKR